MDNARWITLDGGGNNLNILKSQGIVFVMEVIIVDIATEVNMSCRSQGSMYVCIATLVIDLTKEFY